ncbi:TatD family hydrolase [Marinicrinis sediminis]|uniref:TatD family hydrolase n=1 Tax=Marinicrinis sediminis TaxID=1652465 RepID=A0ABW5R6K3_9BACL
MKAKVIDSHVHLDMYTDDELDRILKEGKAEQVDAWITVSKDMESCKRNLAIAQAHPDLVFPCFGLHPEQSLPGDEAQSDLLQWMREHQHVAAAIGEVGLPYFLRMEKQGRGEAFSEEPYLEWLEACIRLAAECQLPLALHAVYEDADQVCDLLEKHSIQRAHFHWYKGSKKTTERMLQNGYMISFNPEVCYEDSAASSVRAYSPDHLMLETDGPWPFEQAFAGHMTAPWMLHAAIDTGAEILGMHKQELYKKLHFNTRQFYLSSRSKWMTSTRSCDNMLP